MNTRAERLAQIQQGCLDVLVVGAGINGAVAASALAARGARVGLIDRADFGGATSANSSCLVWGGIKYLESGDVGLVADLCASRNRLLAAYPDRVREIRFLTSLYRGFRKPAWMLYSGACLYWLMGRGFTRLPEYLDQSALLAREPVINANGLEAGLEYSDAWLPDGDSRFTFGFVLDAAASGAVPLNYVEAQSCVQQADGHWCVQAGDTLTDQPLNLCARYLVNASGPWMDQLRQSIQPLRADLPRWQHRYSKGIHLVVPRIGREQRVLTFFASDGRLFFVIPMGRHTCIGTTDSEVEGPDVRVTDADRQFVLDNINRLLNLPRPLTSADILGERCGVRPLVAPVKRALDDDQHWQQLSRRHELDVQQGWLNIYGGKLTDCLNVGEEVCEHLFHQGLKLAVGDAPRNNWYGEASTNERQAFMAAAEEYGLVQLVSDHVDDPVVNRLWRRYGKRAWSILEAGRDDARQWQPLLQHSDLLRAEARLLAETEMIETLDDCLRRRTLIALQTPKAQLLADPGLAELAQILFAGEAESALQRYRQSADY